MCRSAARQVRRGSALRPLQTRFMVGGWHPQPTYGRLPPIGAAGAAVCPCPTRCILAISSAFAPPAEYDSGFFVHDLATADPELAAAIDGERERQQTQIELIASENIVSRAVLEAQG